MDIEKLSEDKLKVMWYDQFEAKMIAENNMRISNEAKIIADGILQKINKVLAKKSKKK